MVAFDGDGLRVDGDLNLTNITGGGLSLFRATIEGNLWLNGADLNAGVVAPQLNVEGGIYANSVDARDVINLWGARAFTVELRDAIITSNSVALRLKGAQIDQDIDGTGLKVLDGGIDIFGVKIGGQLRLDNATIQNSTSWAIQAAMLNVTGNLYGRRLTADGGVDLAGASIGASLELVR